MWILENVLSTDELASVRDTIADGAFVDGRSTAAGAASVVKHNLQLQRPTDQPVPLDGLLLGALSRHEVFAAAAMPRRISAPMISRYDPGMSYGPHVDDPQIGGARPMRTDLSITLFLSDPADYDGGELVLDTPFGEQAVKLPAGHGFCYPTNVLHRVAPVTRGTRLVAVCWAQSNVHDNEFRQALFELNAVRAVLEDEAPDGAHTRLLRKTITNLTRKLLD